METSLKTGFAQIFSCCPPKSELPKIWRGEAAADGNNEHLYVCVFSLGLIDGQRKRPPQVIPP